jgi:YVTN family beta-propeller protein
LKNIGRVELPGYKVAGKNGSLSDVANWTTFTPDGKFLYISNAGSRSISVVDAPNMKFVKSIPVGEVPKRINTMVTN